MPRRRLPQRPQIEGVLRPSVEVEWAQALARGDVAGIVEPGRAVAIGRRRGGVDQRFPGRGAPAPQRDRRIEVGGDDFVGIVLERRRIRAEMEYRLNLDAIAVKPGQKPLDRHDVAEIAFGDVAPFVPGAKAVDADEIRAAAIIEGCTKHRTDKPAAAGDHQHQAASSLDRARAASASSGECDSRMASISRVVERPSTKSTSTTRPPAASTSVAPTTASIV